MSDLLENERELFEDKINEVLQQQSHILKERESESLIGPTIGKNSSVT